MAQILTLCGFKNARREFFSDVGQKEERIGRFQLIRKDMRGGVKVMMNLPNRHGVKMLE